MPSAIILTTSSANRHAHLVSLGATKCFDRSAQEDTSSIKVATPGDSGVDAILDAVAAASIQTAVFTALSLQGPKIYTQPFNGQNVEVPKGLQSTAIFAQGIFGTKGGMSAMPSLASLVQSGKSKLPVKVEVFGKRFKFIDQGLDKLMEGVSGTEYVVTL